MRVNNYVVRQTNGKYEVLYITDQRSVPLNNCEVIPGPTTDYPKVLDHGNGKLEIVDDTETREAQEFRDKRRKEYPPMTEQLELISDCLAYLKANGTDLGTSGDLYLESIKAVKTKHPKPISLKRKSND